MNRIIKSAVLTAALIISTLSAYAARQDMAQLSGTVLDKSTAEPLGWATVAIMKSDSTLVSGATCDEKGVYSLQTAPGTYIMKVCLIGYIDHIQTVSLKAGVNEIAPVHLAEDAQMLSGATVTDRVSLLEVKMDKLVMNVSQSAFAQGSNALDLIKKAPGVTIDKDGNVTLNGKAVSIWIDGRPSYASGKSLEALLRGTNGESIEKFEIMEHPSSKYDAAGQGGIINIKTKRNMLAGLNGSMGLGGGAMHFKELDRTPWQQSYWLNLAYRTKKTNTFFSIYEGFYLDPIFLSNKLTLPSTDFVQDGTTLLDNLYHNYNVKIGNDWFIDKKNTVGFILYMPGSHATMDADNSVTHQYIAGQHQTKAISEIDNSSRATQYTANLNYTHIFDESRSAEITTNLDYYKSIGKDDNSQNDETFYDAAPEVAVPSSQSIVADQIYDIYSAKADYQTVLFQKFMFETGAKWAMSLTDNNSLEKRTSLPDQQVEFNYREHVAAGYFSLSGQLGTKFTAKAGLRGEYTNSFGDWITAGEVTSRSYFDLFPTVFLGFNPNEKWRLSTSYTRRINRPNYTQLNPTKTYIDSRSYVIGNPDMKPQYSDDLNLSVGFGQHLNFTVGLNDTKNAVSQVPSLEPGGIQILTFDNFGRQTFGFANFSIASLPIGKWLQWTMNATGLYVTTKSDAYDVQTKSLSFQGYTALSFLLPKDWKIEMDANYSTPMRVTNFYIRQHFTSDLAVKKSLLNDRMSITLKCRDLFRTNVDNMDLIDDSPAHALTHLVQRQYVQKILLDLTWSFGTAKQTRQRKVGAFEEMSRTGSSGIGGK